LKQGILNTETATLALKLQRWSKGRKGNTRKERREMTGKQGWKKLIKQVMMFWEGMVVLGGGSPALSC
jgi:hypothetical protein